MGKWVWPTPFNTDRADNPSGGGASGGSSSIALVWVPSPDPAVPDRTTSITEGPRLGSLTVNSSAYGQPRPILYGTIRVGGQMIWSDGIREKETVTVTETDTDVNTDTQYSYFASFAMAFCEGVVDDALRIWANGELIFDKTTTNGVGADVKKDGLTFRFYSGSATQLVDPTMEAADTALGRDGTPAYRGTCYIMFDNFPLADYGNAPPKIEVELVINPPATYSETIGTTFAGSTAVYDPEWSAVDWGRGFVYYANNGNVTDGTFISKVSLRTGQNLLEREIANQTMLGYGLDALSSVSIVSPMGDFCCFRTGLGNDTRLFVLDGDTLAPKAWFGDGSGPGGFAKEGWRWPNFLDFASCYDDNERHDFLCAVDSNHAKVGILKFVDGDTPEFLFSNDEHDVPVLDKAAYYGVVGGKYQEGEAVAYVLGGNTYSSASSDNVVLYKIVIDKNAKSETDELTPFDEILGGIEITSIASFPPSSFKSGETTMTGFGGMLYDQANDAILICMFPSTGAGLPAFVSYNIEQDAINWNIEELLVEPGVHNWSQSRLLGTTFAYTNAQKGTKFNTVTGEIIQNDDTNHWSTGIQGAGMAYDSQSDSTIGYVVPSGGSGPMGRTYYSRADQQGQSLETIVEDLAIRCNIPLVDIETNDLNGTSVPGYAVTNQSTGRGAIQALASIFLFDSYESDWILNFKMQGQAVSKALTESDLAWKKKAEGQKYTERRKQEVELPERFTVNFMDNTNNYIVTAQAVKRVLLPEPAMSSGNTMEVKPPLVLTPTIAKRTAEILLYTTWIERMTYDYRFSWEFLELDPSDVITVTFDDGRVLENRITSMDVGDGLTMEVRGIKQQSGQFDPSTVAADGGAGTKQQVITNFNAARAWAIDAPLLFDYDGNDRTSGITYGFAAGYYDGQFDSCRVYYSPDNGQYANLGQQSIGADWGTVLEPMPDPPFLNPHATDTESTLTVTMQVGSLASVTYDQMSQGQNRALLARIDGRVEVIHYQNVTENADGTYTLDTFLRGRRGTDTMTEDYDGTETFIKLSDEQTIIKIGLPLEELDNPSYYKFVASGQSYQSAGKKTIVSNHRTLMPYAPGQITAIEDGSNNIDFAWERRTRFNGDLVSTTGTVHLNEDTEEYELDIMDGPGTQATETFTSTSFAGGYTDETVEIAGKEYVWKASPSADGEVLTGADEAECLTNLIYAINLEQGSGIPGVHYGGAMTKHPRVTAAQGAGKTVDITAIKYGEFDNINRLKANVTGGSWGDDLMSGGADGAVVRAITGLTSPDYEYSNANIVTDFGAVPSEISINVYQISAQAGRGFAGKVTLNVQ